MNEKLRDKYLGLVEERAIQAEELATSESDKMVSDS
jgi:hypothetical protein